MSWAQSLACRCVQSPKLRRLSSDSTWMLMNSMFRALNVPLAARLKLSTAVINRCLCEKKEACSKQLLVSTRSLCATTEWPTEKNVLREKPAEQQVAVVDLLQEKKKHDQRFHCYLSGSEQFA